LLNKQIKKTKKNLDDNDDENKEEKLIKIERNDRDGYYLSLTKRRAELLQQYLEKNNIIKINNFTLDYKNMEFRGLEKGNSCKIIIPDIKKKSDKIDDLKDELKKEIKIKYIDWLNKL
jgi:hypothetical protein